MQTGRVVETDIKQKQDGTNYQRLNVDLGGTKQWCSNFDHPDFAVGDTVQVEKKGRWWNVTGGQPANGQSQAAAPTTPTSDLPLATYVDAAQYVASEVGDPVLAAAVFEKWATPANLKKFAAYAARKAQPSATPAPPPPSRLEQYQQEVLDDDEYGLPF